MAINYDEQAALTGYIWRNYRSLMNSDENAASNAFAIEGKFASHRESLLRERKRYEDNAYVQQALAGGYDDFAISVRDRVLRDNPDLICLRCPKCKRLVATPKAQQCLWCGEDWHGEK